MLAPCMACNSVHDVSFNCQNAMVVRIAFLERVLGEIARWEMPKGCPDAVPHIFLTTSGNCYEFHWGSNGARDYIKRKADMAVRGTEVL